MYRDDSADVIHMGVRYDTDSLRAYEGINDYALLRAVIRHPQADPRVLGIAIERALLVAGPARVFGDVRRDAARAPELFRDPVRRTLLDRTALPHVWVDSAFIEERDMPLPDARKVLEGMAERVRRGTPFAQVYFETQDAHSYHTAEGPRLTRVGNFGDFVLSAAKRDGEPFRHTEVPEAHVRPLLEASPGQLLILEHRDERDGPMLILYYVQGVYRPAPAT